VSQLFVARLDLFVIHNMGRSCPHCTLWGAGYAPTTGSHTPDGNYYGKVENLRIRWIGTDDNEGRAAGNVLIDAVETISPRSNASSAASAAAIFRGRLS
jgi:hypothetical protein